MLTSLHWSHLVDANQVHLDSARHPAIRARMDIRTQLNFAQWVDLGCNTWVRGKLTSGRIISLNRQKEWCLKHKDLCVLYYNYYMWPWRVNNKHVVPLRWCNPWKHVQHFWIFPLLLRKMQIHFVKLFVPSASLFFLVAASMWNPTNHPFNHSFIK